MRGLDKEHVLDALQGAIDADYFAAQRLNDTAIPLILNAMSTWDADWNIIQCGLLCMQKREIPLSSIESLRLFQFVVNVLTAFREPDVRSIVILETAVRNINTDVLCLCVEMRRGILQQVVELLRKSSTCDLQTSCTDCIRVFCPATWINDKAAGQMFQHIAATLQLQPGSPTIVMASMETLDAHAHRLCQLASKISDELYTAVLQSMQTHSENCQIQIPALHCMASIVMQASDTEGLAETILIAIDEHKGNAAVLQNGLYTLAAAAHQCNLASVLDVEWLLQLMQQSGMSAESAESILIVLTQVVMSSNQSNGCLSLSLKMESMRSLVAALQRHDNDDLVLLCLNLFSILLEDHSVLDIVRTDTAYSQLYVELLHGVQEKLMMRIPAIQQTACKILTSMALEHHPTKIVVCDAGVVACLIEQLGSSELPVQVHICVLLATLASFDKGANCIADAAGVAIVCDLMKSQDDITLQLACMRTISCMRAYHIPTGNISAITATRDMANHLLRSREMHKIEQGECAELVRLAHGVLGALGVPPDDDGMPFDDEF